MMLFNTLLSANVSVESSVNTKIVFTETADARNSFDGKRTVATEQLNI